MLLHKDLSVGGLWRSSPISLAVAADNPADPADKFARARHVDLMGRKLQAILRSPQRTMVSMPPRHGKSSTISLWAPLWLLAIRPQSRVCVASYSAELATGFSRQARGIAESVAWMGVQISDDRATQRHWMTQQGGEFYATGLKSITGKGFDLIVVDDAISGTEAAASETQRESVWNWWREDVLTRVEEKTSVFVVGTRWHEDDLIGRLLRQGQSQWEYIRLPAFAEDDDDPIGRKKGERLWPERFSQEYYDQQRESVGELSWAGLYQQRPAPAEGSMFRTDWWQFADAAPAQGQCVRGWDLAATSGGGDWTVGVRMRRTGDGVFWLDDIVRIQGSPGEVEQLIRRTAERDGAGVIVDIPQDPGQAGKAQAESLTKMLAGYQVRTGSESGDKATRAAAYSAQVQAGNVRLVQASWNEPYMEELAVFPNGLHDDQVDASSRAFHRLLAAKKNVFAPAKRYRRR